MRQECLRKWGVIAQHADSGALAQSDDGALGHSRGCGHAEQLSRQATLAKEISRAQDCHDRFLTLLGDDRQLDFSLLYVEQGVGRIALAKDDLAFFVGYGLLSAECGHKSLRRQFSLPGWCSGGHGDELPLTPA